MTSAPNPKSQCPGPEVPKVSNSPEAEVMFQVQRRAEQLMLGQVSIVNATLREAVDTLKRLGVQYDREANPAMRGISIVIKLGVSDSASSGESAGSLGWSRRPAPPDQASQRLNYVAQNVSFAKAIEAVAAARGDGSSAMQPSMT